MSRQFERHTRHLHTTSSTRPFTVHSTQFTRFCTSVQLIRISFCVSRWTTDLTISNNSMVSFLMQLKFSDLCGYNINIIRTKIKENYWAWVTFDSPIVFRELKIWSIDWFLSTRTDSDSTTIWPIKSMLIDDVKRIDIGLIHRSLVSNQITNVNVWSIQG